MARVGPLHLARGQRRRLGLTADSHAFVQNRVACLATAGPCLVAAPAAWPRARFTTLVAPLNHMLMKGFFFVQGFVMGLLMLRLGDNAIDAPWF